MATDDSKLKVQGGCHCGYIKYSFTASPDLLLNANRCNCSFCQKLGTTNLHLAKDVNSTFTLLSPGSKAELPNYAPRIKSVARYFCDKCGTHVWMEGSYPHGGKEHELFAVNLATVDQPQEGIDLSQTKIRYFDMLRENYAGGLKDTPWPNGLL
ncbi:hypothetical protein K431DRAFT_285890 [Polychaeton citri CBS 116435]|uniref:CENP-V/GFA domain-containing protein n=1 Tax=Polychaeton citri CBS 116435 TaxID=1314669 RepID=A0A9P4Q5Z2_9PEZI|nr:hypothetical protein K431DRAFT_285890 [Polychaeton citri CBS 116435]